MKKFVFLAATILTAASLLAQKPYQRVWISGDVGYTSEDKGNYISFVGGTCHEGGYDFALKKTADENTFILGPLMEGGEWVPEGKIGDIVRFEICDGTPLFAVYHNKKVTDVLIQDKNVGLYQQICDNMALQLQGEYRDKAGNTYVFSGYSCRLGNLVPKMTEYKFGEEYESPEDIIIVGNKMFYFDFTLEGLKLYNATYNSENDYYEKGSLAVSLKHVDTGDGRWAWTKDRLIYRSMLCGFSKKALRLMRNEIFARRGYTFSSKDLKDYFGSKPWYKPLGDNSKVQFTRKEQICIELIQAEEAVPDSDRYGVSNE